MGFQTSPATLIISTKDHQNDESNYIIWPSYITLQLNWSYSVPYFTDTDSAMFSAVLFKISRKLKLPKVLPQTEEWQIKMWYIYAMEYYSFVKIK